MSRIIRSTKFWLVAGAVTAALAGTAYAAIPGGDGVIHGCYAKSSGTLAAGPGGGSAPRAPGGAVRGPTQRHLALAVVGVRRRVRRCGRRRPSSRLCAVSSIPTPARPSRALSTAASSLSAIAEDQRLYRWPLGRRPDDHPGLSDLGL
jgi:hypothetical protein